MRCDEKCYKASASINDLLGMRGGRVGGTCRRSYEEQTRGTFTEALSPIDGFPAERTRLAEDVSFTPDAFHSGSRLEKVPEAVLTSQSTREVLTLNQVVRHAPRDINREDDGLINLCGGHLLN